MEYDFQSKFQNERIVKEVDEKLSKLNLDEIKNIAEQFRAEKLSMLKKTTIVSLILTILGVVFSVVCFIDLEILVDILPYSSIFISIGVSLLIGSFIVKNKYKKLDVKTLAQKSLMKQVSNSISTEPKSNLPPNIYKRDSEYLQKNNFSASKILDLTTIFSFNKNQLHKFMIDQISKKFVMQFGTENFSNIYTFKDIVNYEIYENGNSQLQSNAGGALIGGLFFGITGAIIGSSTQQNINNICTDLSLIIRLNNFQEPELKIEFIANENIDKSSSTYKTIKTNLQEICSNIEFMINNRTLEDSISISKQETTSSSIKEKLKELKELLEEGLISQEDYDMQKKEILKNNKS